MGRAWPGDWAVGAPAREDMEVGEGLERRLAAGVLIIRARLAGAELRLGPDNRPVLVHASAVAPSLIDALAAVREEVVALLSDPGGALGVEEAGGEEDGAVARARSVSPGTEVSDAG